MSTLIDLKFINHQNDKEKEEKDNDKEQKESENENENEIEEIDNYDIDVDIKNEIKHIKNKEKIFVKLWRLYSVLDKFFIIINFSTLLFSIFISESNVSLALSIYTLSFSIVFDTKKYISTLEKLIILYQDEIIPDVNKCIRKYYKNDNCDTYSDIIYELQHIEKENLNKYLGCSFNVPKKLRSIDWKRIFLILFIYIISFTSLSVACYFKSIGKLEF